MSQISSVSHSYAANTSNSRIDISTEQGIIAAPQNQPDSQFATIKQPQEESFLHRLAEGVREARRSAGDAALGVGQLASTAARSVLPRVVATPVSTTIAGAGRFLGGAVTLAGTGYRVISSYNKEKAAGSENFPETRKEVVVSAASITAGVVTGTAAGLLASAVAVVGAPAIVVGGVTVAGIVGVGLVAHKVRGMAAEAYENYGR